MNEVKQEPRDPDVRPPPENVPPNPQTNAIVNAIIRAVQPVRDGCDYGEAVEMQRDGLPTAMWNGPRDHLLFFRLTQTDDDQVTGQCVQCLEVKERDQGVDAAGIRQQIVQNRGVGRVFFHDGRFVDSNPMRPEGIVHICGVPAEPLQGPPPNQSVPVPASPPPGPSRVRVKQEASEPGPDRPGPSQNNPANIQQSPSGSRPTSRPTSRPQNPTPRRARDSSSSSSSSYSPTPRKKPRDASTERKPKMEAERDFGPVPTSYREDGERLLRYTNPTSRRTYLFVQTSRSSNKAHYRCKACVNVACARKENGHKDVRTVEVVNGRFATDPDCPRGQPHRCQRTEQNGSFLTPATDATRTPASVHVPAPRPASDTLDERMCRVFNAAAAAARAIARSTSSAGHPGPGANANPSATRTPPVTPGRPQQTALKTSGSAFGLAARIASGPGAAHPDPTMQNALNRLHARIHTGNNGWTALKSSGVPVPPLRPAAPGAAAATAHAGSSNRPGQGSSTTPPRPSDTPSKGTAPGSSSKGNTPGSSSKGNTPGSSSKANTPRSASKGGSSKGDASESASKRRSSGSGTGRSTSPPRRNPRRSVLNPTSPGGSAAVNSLQKSYSAASTVPASPDSDDDRASPAAQAGADDVNFGRAAPIGATGNRVAFHSRRWPGHTFTFSNTMDPNIDGGLDMEEAKYFCEECRRNGWPCSVFVIDGVFVTDPDNPETDHCCVDVANAIDPNAVPASPVPAPPSPQEQAPPSPTAITQPDEEQAVEDLLVATDVPGTSGSRSPSNEKESSNEKEPREDFGAASFLDAEQQRFAYDSRRHPGQVLTFIRAYTEPNDTVRYRCEGCMSRFPKMPRQEHHVYLRGGLITHTNPDEACALRETGEHYTPAPPPQGDDHEEQRAAGTPSAAPQGTPSAAPPNDQAAAQQGDPSAAQQERQDPTKLGPSATPSTAPQDGQDAAESGSHSTSQQGDPSADASGESCTAPQATPSVVQSGDPSAAPQGRPSMAHSGDPSVAQQGDPSTAPQGSQGVAQPPSTPEPSRPPSEPSRPPSEPTQDTKPASGANRSSVGTGGPHRTPQATPLRPLRLSGLNTPLSQAGTPTLRRQQRYFGDAKYEQEGDPSSFIYTSESTGLTYRFVLSHANRHPDSGHMVRLYKCERCQQWQETDDYHDVPLYTITTHDQRIVIHDPDLPHGLPHLCVQAEQAQAAGETLSNAESTSEETTDESAENNAKRSPADQQ